MVEHSTAVATSVVEPARKRPHLEIVRQASALRQRIEGWRREGQRIGFVPTMGALHAGHLSLVHHACARGELVVVSIFVNPTQFGPGEDLERYPRTPEADAEALAAAGCDLLFMPEVETIYPPGHSTWVEVEGPTEGCEADARPGHFRGMATVVCQLFNLVRPDFAVFGQKDAQQLAVVRKMVRDLHLPIEIVAAPIVRDTDGLALSSRNVYLEPAARHAATALPRALADAERAIAAGERNAAALERQVRQALTAVPGGRVDYVAVVESDSFKPLVHLAGQVTIAIAVRFGATRLLDNLQVCLPQNGESPHHQKPIARELSGVTQ